ncbi:hypothetical protein [Saccharomonospora cyanea]|uniref:DUF4878 domain-containing protein n=1 Tax=Saccharomonospora cyanea NA-134 TaxID=882082 RepID=H5XD44_9PSEU|nr:hypothetical protein [Saccharomonospora cyanea]EHR63475.1 hypothetical protein SaccyDRAFT_4668 [Saccharomonospora cyanea NA-134]
MDPLTLAGQAVSFLCGYLTQVASGVVQRTQDSAAEALYGMIATRLRQTAFGDRALRRLETAPGDNQAASEAQRTLAQEVQSDPAFAADLGRAVQNVWSAQGGVSQSTFEQGNTTVSGATMRKSVIAGGNVDQSRRQTRISFGGWTAIAAILLLGGTGSVVAISTGSGGVDTSSIGDAPGEEGARETAMAFVESMRSSDAELFCDLLHSEIVGNLEVHFGRPCPETVPVILDRITPEMKEEAKQAQVLSVTMESQSRAVVVVGIDNTEEGSAELRLRRDFDRWRVDLSRDTSNSFGFP